MDSEPTQLAATQSDLQRDSRIWRFLSGIVLGYMVFWFLPGVLDALHVVIVASIRPATFDNPSAFVHDQMTPGTGQWWITQGITVVSALIGGFVASSWSWPTPRSWGAPAVLAAITGLLAATKIPYSPSTVTAVVFLIEIPAAVMSGAFLDHYRRARAANTKKHGPWRQSASDELSDSNHWQRAPGKLIKNILIAVLVGLGILGGFICLIWAGLFWMADPYYLTAPSDEQLIANFQEHRAAYEKLRKMASKDLEGCSYDSGQLSYAKRQQYRRLISEISPNMGVCADSSVGVRFIFVEGAILAIGPEWAKGIEYWPGNPDRVGEIRKSLDRPASLPTGDVYLRQIAPKWFIFFQNS